MDASPGTTLGASIQPSFRQALDAAAEDYERVRQQEIARTGSRFSVYRGHPVLEEAEERYQQAFLASVQDLPEQAELLRYWRSAEAFAYQQKFCTATGIDLWAGKPGKRTFCEWQSAEKVIASLGYRPVGLREVRNSLPFPRVSRHFPRKVYLDYLARITSGETQVLHSDELLRQNVRAAGILNEAGLL